MEENKENNSIRIRHSRFLTSHIRIKKINEKSVKRIGVFPIQNMNFMVTLSPCSTKSYSKSPMAKAPVIRESK